MQAEPGAAQRGHQFGDLLGLQGSVGQHQKYHGHCRRPDPLGFELCLHHDEHHRNAPGEGGGEFKLVGQGQPPGNDAPGGDIGRVAYRTG